MEEQLGVYFNHAGDRGIEKGMIPTKSSAWVVHSGSPEDEECQRGAQVCLVAMLVWRCDRWWVSSEMAVRLEPQPPLYVAPLPERTLGYEVAMQLSAPKHVI